jgi:hypothetical protein
MTTLSAPRDTREEWLANAVGLQPPLRENTFASEPGRARRG